MDARDEKRVQELEEELEELKHEFREYVKKQQEDEKKKLRMALLWAGAVIIALFSFLWNEMIWPIFKAGLNK